ncbi:MAG: M24 family metallopeptidase, partial [Actinomycetota bacterium]
VDVLLAGPSADLRYLTGYDAPPLERLTMLVLPADGEAVLVVPALERPRAEDSGAGWVARITTWDETDDPYTLVAEASGATPSRIAVGERMWAMFVLALQERFSSAGFTSSTSVMRALRVRKDDAELDLLRRAAAATDAVAAGLAGEKVSGRTERSLSRTIGEWLLASGCEHVGFAIVASGPNAASPHHEPGERVIEQRDALVCDFGGTIEGYSSDITRTFVVGEPPDGFSDAYAVLAKAQDAAVSAVAPGVAAQDVDAAARAIIADAGFGDAFIHRTGHGIGLEVHEDPYIVWGNTESLEPGMTFSIEPGIYLPGRFGMRIEDIVAVTDDGVERLNQAPRNPVMLA